MTTTNSSAKTAATVAAPCALTAMGLVNCLGVGQAQIWPRLLAGDQSGFVRRGDFIPGMELLVGAVSAELLSIPDSLSRYDCRNNALSLRALQQIEPAVRAAIAKFGPGRIGVVMGTSTSGSAEGEAAILNHYRHGFLLPRFEYPQLEFGGAAGFVAAYLGVLGPTFSLSTACSSSARALASARSLLALGVCDAVIAGGADSLCGLTTHGFHSLQAISASASNPFSVHRNGLTLGEGAAVFLVTRDAGGIQLLGVGESTEAHHISAPDPEGRGAEASMRGALSDAGLAPDAIAYLNLHGTGTQLNDEMEGAAVHRIFGSRLPCSSTKSLVGHTLGAAGAMELAFCWMMLASRTGATLPLLPHRYDGERDPKIPEIDLVALGAVREITGRAYVMTNSFGFGGNNCTLILGDGGVA